MISLRTTFIALIRSLPLLAALTLAGCAGAPAPRPDMPAERALQIRLERLAEIENWICVGRVGASDGSDSLSASLRWVQSGGGFRIRLSGPLGQGLVEVTGTETSVSLRTSERRTYYASSPEALLSERFGWRLPVSGLRYWILGLPVPGAEVDGRGLDAYGRFTHLQQSGWRIDYLEYRSVDGVDLPSRLNLEHPGLKARIAVRRWQLPA